MTQLSRVPVKALEIRDASGHYALAWWDGGRFVAQTASQRLRRRLKRAFRRPVLTWHCQRDQFGGVECSRAWVHPDDPRYGYEAYMHFGQLRLPRTTVEGVAVAPVRGASDSRPNPPRVRRAGPGEIRQMLDGHARHVTGMTGDDFRRWWEQQTGKEKMEHLQQRRELWPCVSLAGWLRERERRIAERRSSEEWAGRAAPWSDGAPEGCVAGRAKASRQAHAATGTTDTRDATGPVPRASTG
jgi:hypothetical protein